MDPGKPGSRRPSRDTRTAWSCAVHDFNNLMMEVTGNLDLIENCADNTKKVRQLVRSAQRAAERAARLTSELYGRWCRCEIAEGDGTETVAVDELVAKFEGLIRRALRDTISVEMVVASGLWLCRVDPVQFESSLLTEVFNARDAMLAGGRLRIELSNSADTDHVRVLIRTDGAPNWETSLLVPRDRSPSGWHGRQKP